MPGYNIHPSIPGTVIGAGLGGALGYAGYGGKKERVRNTVIGAVAGGIAGHGVGHLAARARKMEAITGHSPYGKRLGGDHHFGKSDFEKRHQQWKDDFNRRQQEHRKRTEEFHRKRTEEFHRKRTEEFHRKRQDDFNRAREERNKDWEKHWGSRREKYNYKYDGGSSGHSGFHTSSHEPHLGPLGATGKETTKAELKKLYRDKAKVHHPDKGGDPEKMKQVNSAWDNIQKTPWFHKLAYFWQGFDKRASALGHAAELGGLGILAAPSVGDLRNKPWSEKNKARAEVAGLGILAAPYAHDAVKGAIRHFRG